MKKAGMLIVFEGAGRSGKSTLIQQLKQRLEQAGDAVTFTEWNSYAPLQELINHKKTHFTFTPHSYSAVHLAEFSLRHEEIVKPALEQGGVVIADRWVYTALTRDVARGIPSDTVRACYSFARTPDLVFFVEVPAEVAYERHLATKKYFGYNSGTDIWPDLTPAEAFVRYHQLTNELYAEMADQEGFIRLDGLKQPGELAEEVWQQVRKRQGERISSHDAPKVLR